MPNDHRAFLVKHLEISVTVESVNMSEICEHGGFFCGASHKYGLLDT